MNKNDRIRLQEALDIIMEIRDQEEEKLSNMPENLQDSDRGYQFQDGIDKLEEIQGSLEELVEGGY